MNTEKSSRQWMKNGQEKEFANESVNEGKEKAKEDDTIDR